MNEIIPPLVAMNVSFEEFVALKAFVSFQGGSMFHLFHVLSREFCYQYVRDLSLNFSLLISGMMNVSEEARPLMRRQLESVTVALHAHYRERGIDVAERLGGIILLLSSIFVSLFRAVHKAFF